MTKTEEGIIKSVFLLRHMELNKREYDIQKALDFCLEGIDENDELLEDDKWHLDFDWTVLTRDKNDFTRMGERLKLVESGAKIWISKSYNACNSSDPAKAYKVFCARVLYDYYINHKDFRELMETFCDCDYFEAKDLDERMRIVEHKQIYV